MKIKDDNLCSFCNGYPETIQHLFFECVNVNRFWKQLCKWISDKCTHCTSLNMDIQLAIFGISENIKTDKVLDLIILMAKKYIYRQKCMNKHLEFKCFQKEVVSRYKIEKYIAYTKCAWNKFNTNWAYYQELIKENSVSD